MSTRTWSGERLKALREKRGFTMVELAYKCGAKSTQHIRAWEDGTQPTGSYLLSVADALGVEPNYFYQEDGTDERHP